MRYCNKCQQTMPEEKFYATRNYCKDCQATYRKKYRAANPNYTKEYRRKNKEQMLNADLKWRYGVTLTTYNNMFEEQEGKCAICTRHQLEFTRRLAVDHEHERGFIRGLLCDGCNRMVGLFEAGRLTTFSELYEAIESYVSSEGVEYTFPI